MSLTVEFLITATFIGIFWANIFASFQVWMGPQPLNLAQKYKQTFFVWFVPILGAAWVFWKMFLRAKGQMS